MKQIIQHLHDGTTEVIEVPAPRAGAGQLLIRTSRSLISAGTERMLVDFGKASLIEKARQQPDKVRQVLDKVRTDGLAPTLEAVRAKLDQPLPLGYCNVGRIVEVGHGVPGFTVGDRVASNGRHAEIVNVPVNLCARIPDAVSDDAAAFTVLGAVGLQGIRLAAPTLGEAVAVTGLGLIGLMTVQLLRAHGCRVLGIDLDPSKLALARTFGAETVDLAAGEDTLAAAQRFSRGRGIDAVIVTAATRSSEPIRQAAQMCRKRGRIVLVGVTGLELSRADFYEKELTFQVSCSYGPGRYDPAYEQAGQDYPFGLVRWTEQRNFEAVLDMLADVRIEVASLISHRFAVTQAAKAYTLISSDAPSLGVVLEYPDAEADLPAGRSGAAPLQRTLPTSPALLKVGSNAPVISFLGAGNYATRTLMPAFRRHGVRLRHVCTLGGLNSELARRKFGFELATTETDAVLADPAVDAVIVATRHDTHARLAAAALQAGKSVFVEKPLGLTLAELDAVRSAYDDRRREGESPLLCVGFNRRFAPLALKLRALLAARAEPKALVMTVNAGTIPADHWTQSHSEGGGRIVGEACHFVDFLRFLTGSEIVEQRRASLASSAADTATLQLAFADGSIGTVHYFANGHRSLAKERLEVFCGGGVLMLDNFIRLRGRGWPGFSRQALWAQDKGADACVAAFVSAMRSGSASPIAFDEILEVSRASVRLAGSVEGP